MAAPPVFTAIFNLPGRYALTGKLDGEANNAHITAFRAFCLFNATFIFISLVGLLDRLQAVVRMSAMWLVPQYCLHGLAEAFSAIGQNEFYYSEFPKSMSSIAVSLFLLGTAAANLLASLILSTIEHGRCSQLVCT